MRDAAVNDKSDIERAFEFPGALKAGILLAALLFLYFPSFADMVGTWRNSEAYSHGFLIPFVSAFLVWRKRKSLQSLSTETYSRGFFMFLAGLVLLLAGSLAFDPFTFRISFLLVLSGLLLIFLGREIFRELAFPIGYLFFMIPLPYIFMKSMAVGMKLTYAKLTYLAVSAAGVPILMEGVCLELPNASLVVGDYCTGVLSIVAITAISTLYAYLSQRTLAGMALLVILAVPLAMLGNMLRLVSTVWLTYIYGPRVLDSAIHKYHGLLNFLITMAFLILLAKGVSVIDSKLAKEVPG
ncbi:exosortase/archaeosortase family protein [Candidatus Moduliflexota bacterium]